MTHTTHFKQFIPFLRPYRWYLVGALLALIVTAAVTLTFGQGLRLLVDKGLASGSLVQLNEMVLLFIGIILLLGMGTFARFYIVTWLGEKVSADLRQAVFNQVLYLPIQFFEDHPVGDLQSRIITDTTIIQQVIGGSLSVALRNLLLLVGGLILLLTSNLQLTLFAFALMPIVLLPILIFGRRVKYLSRINQDQVAHLGAYLSESLQQIKTVQSFNHQPYDIQQFHKRIDDILSAARSRITQRAALISCVIILVLCAVVGLLWFGGRSVLAGTLTVGELVAFLFYAILVAGSVGALSEVLTDLQRAYGATERLFELLTVPVFSPSPEIKENPQQPAKIFIQQLNFAYPTRAQSVIHNFNLTLAPGSSLALVGPSGAGKSTLFELILGFYQLPTNSIFFDDQDITTLSLVDLRNQIAWLPQNPAIFSGTIWDNLRYGKPNASATEIENAALAAHVTEFIQQMPKGYQTEVGESGVRLSGGQRQRIAIARALLRKPRLLLLDEPTSALDAHSEDMIQQALKHIMPTCTTIIIAHRLATVKAMPQIAVMEKGTLIAQGTHEQLMTSSPLYADLARLQLIDSNPAS